MMPEDELVELLDHRIAHAAETHLRGALIVLQSLAGNDAGNLHRLRQVPN